MALNIWVVLEMLIGLKFIKASASCLETFCCWNPSIKRLYNKGCDTNKGISYNYFSNGFNSTISGDHYQNVLSRALNLPDMSYSKNVVMLYETKNICTDYPYDNA